jgi:dCMP deaminase
MPHCDEVGHQLRKVIDEDGNIKQHCVRTIHAEQNALIQAARFGISLDGATLYCKMEPCRNCAMSIVGAGIKKVVCEKRYHASDDTKNIFSNCGIELIVLTDELEQYENT